MIRKENKRSPGAHGAAGVRIQERLRSRAAGAAAALMSLVAVLCAGCAEDPTEQPRGPQGGTGDYALLQLTVPGAAAGTRAAMPPAQEGGIAIADTHIVLCQKWDAGWYLNRVIALAECTVTESADPDANGYKTYNIEVPFETGTKGSKYCLGVIAGFDGGKAALEAAVNPFYGNELDAADPLRDIRTSLVATAAGKWPSDRMFPMWGESDEFTQVPNGSIGTLSLMRATARVDVGVKFIKNGDKYNLNDMQAEGLYNEGKGTYFALASVRVYGTMKGGTYGSAENVYGSITSEPSAATVPNTDVGKFGLEDLKYEEGTDNDFTDSTPADGGTWSDKEKSARRMLTRACYVFETKNAGAEFDDAACVIVGGYYGEDQNPTFYRIDFARPNIVNGVQNKPQPDDRFDLLRNKVYVVNITSVSGPGKNSPEEALKSDETKMTAEVQEWNQNDKVGDITTDGVYTLSVDKSELQYYTDGTPEQIVVKTDYDGVLGSGWTLEAEAEKADEQQEFEDALLYYDSKGNAYPYTSDAFPKTGPSGTPATLRIGMRELTDAGGKTAFRSGKLLFKAGRMQTRVVIQQTSQDLLRILFDPEEILFGAGYQDANENKKLTQTVKIAVTTKKPYELTITGKKADGSSYTQTIYNTNDPAQVSKNNPDDRFDVFFTREDATVGGDSTRFLLLPKYFDGDRSFTFEVTASLPDFKDVAPVKERLMVYQFKNQLRWLVDADQGQYRLTENPWHVIVAHDKEVVKPKIRFDPSAQIPSWWFSKGDDMMGDIGWIKNLSSFIGVDLKDTFATNGVLVAMEKNPGISRRSLSLQVETQTGQLMASDSKLVITQLGQPLKLEPSVVSTTNPANVQIREIQPADPLQGTKGVYELDHGTGADGAEYTLAMRANTDWNWYWHADHGDMSGEHEKLVILPYSWDEKVTTPTADHAIRNGYWDPVVTFQVPYVPKVEWGQRDPAKPHEDVPLGGRRTVVRELRNVSPKLTPEDVEDYARELRITRDLPAYTHILKWPYEDSKDPNAPDDETKRTPFNLDNLVADGTYEQKKFEALSNAPISLTLWQGDAMDKEFMQVGRVDWASDKGYKLWDKQHFAQMPGMKILTTESAKEPATFYKLEAEYTYYDGTKNITDTVAQYAYTGYKAVMPLRNMTSEQRFISYEAHTGNNALVFNFKNSYFREMTVLARVVLCYPNYDEVKEGDKFYEPPKYFPDDPTGLQGKKLADCVGKTLMSTDPTNNDNFYLTLDLPENKHNNLIYRVDVLFYDNSNIDKWNYDSELSPVVWQDAKGYGDGNGTFYVVRNELQRMEGNTLSRAYGPNPFCREFSYTDKENREWKYYWDAVNTNASNLKTAVIACNAEYQWALPEKYDVRLSGATHNINTFGRIYGNAGSMHPTAAGKPWVDHIIACPKLSEFPYTNKIANYKDYDNQIYWTGYAVGSNNSYTACPHCGNPVYPVTPTKLSYVMTVFIDGQPTPKQEITVNSAFPIVRYRAENDTIDTSQANAFFEQSK